MSKSMVVVHGWRHLLQDRAARVGEPDVGSLARDHHRPEHPEDEPSADGPGQPQPRVETDAVRTRHRLAARPAGGGGGGTLHYGGIMIIWSIYTGKKKNKNNRNKQSNKKPQLT